METLPQTYDPPVNSGATMSHYLHCYHPSTLSGEFSPITSDHPFWSPRLQAAAQADMSKTSTSTSTNFVSPIVNAFKTLSIRVAENSAACRSSENSTVDNGANFSAIPDEVNKKEVSKEQRPIWRCRDCGKPCNSSASLQMHKQSHSRSWKCRICKKALLHRWIPKFYCRIRTDKRPFVCSVCQHALPTAQACKPARGHRWR
ncbi:Zinc finger and BTB domain-containing protein 24 [Taenia solium]|eukprot:TsM_000292100 transcript=TsM_000292100 gene=TsM_000292100